MDRLLTLAAGAALMIACTGKEAETPDELETMETPTDMAPMTFAEQVSAGQVLYSRHCASCHGGSGEGTAKGPRVVGVAQGALPLDPAPRAEARTMQFKTAADVAKFVVESMPMDDPGSLEEHEYWSILAFDLKANGITLPNKLDATTAGQVVLHK